MAGIAVVVFDVDCMCFADNMAFGRNYLGKSVPIIGIEHTIFKMFYFIVQSSDSCTITVAEHPGHSSPSATVKRFEEP